MRIGTPLLIALSAISSTVALAGPSVRLEGDAKAGSLTHIGWDTEGGDRAAVNLLRPKSAVTVRVNVSNGGGRHDAKADEITLRWTEAEGGFDLTASVAPTMDGRLDGIELVFPFDPRASAVTVLPGEIDDQETFRFPAIVSAPGSGQMRVTPDSGVPEAMTLEGSRREKRIDWRVILSLWHTGPDGRWTRDHVTLRFRPVHLAAPKGLRDEKRWAAVRRSWFNVFQISSRWGDPNNPSSAPAGVLANNVISDPVSSCLYVYADAALLTPELGDGVSAMRLVGHTLDWWIDKRMLPSGEVRGYTSYTDFLDPNPSILISAWDYVEATRDHEWLKARLDKLEKVAAFSIGRDLDHDGMLEAVQSGNAYTLKVPQRSCSGHDAINCGNKDAYSNLLAYRAFRCMADLETQIGRAEKAKTYSDQADLLKATFAKLMVNPKTGYVVMWISRDGELHDYAAPWINTLAIAYGVIPREQGRDIIRRLRTKMDELGFKRPELGVPTTLLPVRRADYLIGAVGCPEREDGTDTFGYYLNGGVISADAFRFATGCYTAGLDADGDYVLDAMLARLAKGDLPSGGFPVNIVNKYPDGGEFFTWDGTTCGYEGLLSHNWAWVAAVPMRDAALRHRLYRPLNLP